MAGTHSLIQVLKAELKAAGITYAQLAQQLGLAESSVKRMLARGDMPLSRIDQICTVLHTDFAELARRVGAQQAPRLMLSQAQEAAVVANPKLLLVAICALSQWTLEQMLATYHLSEAEAVASLVQLDRLGIIELRPHNRYRLNLSKTLRWRPDGPVMRYFRERVVGDYYSAGFDGEGELLMLVHGQISPAQAQVFNDRLQRLAEDFAQQHLADQRLAPTQRRAYTLMLGMRSWLFAAFREFKRDPDGPAQAGPPSARPAQAGPPSARPAQAKPPSARTAQTGPPNALPAPAASGHASPSRRTDRTHRPPLSPATD